VLESLVEESGADSSVAIFAKDTRARDELGNGSWIGGEHGCGNNP